MKAIKVIAALLLLTIACAPLQVWATPSEEATWWDSHRLYRRKLTFNAGDISEGLTNFPVLVKLSSSNFNFTLAKTHGEDVRFVDSDDTTALKYEIEKWDKTGEEAIIWVKVPQIVSASSTDFIYMYYGNASGSDAQDPENVWDSHFVGVWHFCC